ncbi:MAG: adenylyltransferase/cytidyltransferase family protein [Planctomycetota bacterium]
MRTIRAISELQQIRKGCVLTIGNFDGVHRGHQEILVAARAAAEERGTELVAMTFEPHPVAILYPERAPGVLTPLEVKADLLRQCSVDSLIVLQDSRELLSLSAEDFVGRFLVENVTPSAVIEGRDFNFGAARAGNIESLRRLGAEKGFDVSVVEPKEIKLSTGQSGFQHHDSLYARERPRRRRPRGVGQALPAHRRNYPGPGHRQEAGLSHAEHGEAKAGNSR